MTSKTIITFTIIVALASALSGVVVYHFTENSSTSPNISTNSGISITTQTATPTLFQGVTRTYYIAADEVKWNYAPTGMNMITGLSLAANNKTALYTINGKDRIGSVYLKCLYEGYTDDTFTTKQTRTAQWQHLGLLGPVIHAAVGDTIKVVFKNNCRFPVSMHPHGVLYDKASEGSPYNDGIPESEKLGDSVAPNGTYTYTWYVPERAGPGPDDPSSIIWMYHSHVDEVGDTYAGLLGPIIITRHGEANPDGTPKGVDREFVTMFSIFDESRSPYFDYNINTFAQDPSSVDQNDPDFQESNLKHSINGYIFGNLPGLTMKQYTHVRWYVVGVGTEQDLHTPHWHGNTLLMDGMRTDMVELLPMSMKTLDMYPDNPGTWQLHCHVNDHIQAGMLSLYTVEKNNDTQGTNSSSNGTLKISLSTDPGTLVADEPSRLAISFLDSKTNTLEEHVDYKVTIMKGNDQVFGTSFLHTAEGSVTIPYQFQDAGTYNVMVEVDGIYFMPISEITQFSINVGNQ
ncbi:MAG TPA: multicopper oxidase domain-containing protein [Candidatus Nitrosotalea sp.]|nr:multicopper oxidase domain-containing protein [Candidatus Nitrosotalea sp.]